MNKKLILILSTVIVLIAAIGIIYYSMFGKGKEVALLSMESVSNQYYKNPLSINNIGDPFVLKASNGKYYCYPTSSDRGYKVWSSDDLVNWKDEGLIYEANAKSWAYADFWAPEVVEYKGKFYMYYTARGAENQSLRIGVAVSESPTGPFKDVFERPMFDFGYAAIDANVLIDDDGKKYLYFSRDCSENVIDGKHESHIYGVELNDDMVNVKGEPVLLAKPEQKWELKSGPEFFWNEGPTVFKRNGTYYLMYSANFYASRDYSVGYATAKEPLGKYTKYENNPVLSAETENVSGPGHHSIAVSPDGSEMFVIYHTHTNPVVGGGDRQVCIDRMGFREDGSIFVNGPTLTEQPVPALSNGLYNIAPEAKVTTSSVKDGFRNEALNDKEIGMYLKNEKLEWKSGNEDKNPWVKLEWDKKRTISSVLIYKSANAKATISEGELVFSNGAVIKNIKFSTELGTAAIANFPEQEVKWVKFVPAAATGEEKTIGLSEIEVLGKK